MKKRTKTIWERVVVLFCALALFLCGLAVPASATDSNSGSANAMEKDLGEPDDLLWSYSGKEVPYPLGDGTLYCAIRDGSVTIYESRNLKGDVVIPETIEGLPVTAIWFQNFPSSTGPHHYAFAHSPEITSITFPASLQKLDFHENLLHAFGSGKLRKITFQGNALESIPFECFRYYEYLDEIVLPESVKEIDDFAFANSPNLKKIYNTSKVTEFGKDMFAECKNLNPFEDTYGRWHEEYAKWAFQNDLFAGITPFTFGPDQKMTRGMFAAVLYRLEGEPKVSGNAPFADVRNDAYYTQAVNWAAQEGIVYGTTDKTFSPEKSMTREQMVSMLYRYAEKKGEKYNTALWGDLAAFTDSGKITAYAKDAFNWAVGAGIVSGKGDGTLDPQGTATRAEVAAVLKNLVEK